MQVIHTHCNPDNPKPVWVWVAVWETEYGSCWDHGETEKEAIYKLVWRYPDQLSEYVVVFVPPAA